jgi:hypothetical protein
VRSTVGALVRREDFNFLETVEDLQTTTARREVAASSRPHSRQPVPYENQILNPAPESWGLKQYYTVSSPNSSKNERKSIRPPRRERKRRTSQPRESIRILDARQELGDKVEMVSGFPLFPDAPETVPDTAFPAGRDQLAGRAHAGSSQAGTTRASSLHESGGEPPHSRAPAAPSGPPA